jgi:hypothetical protein
MLKAGTHRGTLAGQVIIYEGEKGAVMAVMPFIIPHDEGNWTGPARIVLVKNDGTVQTRQVDVLKKLFNWDGQIESLPKAYFRWDGEEAFPIPEDVAIEADLACVYEEYTPPEGEPRQVFKISWVNVPGESGFRMPEPADRKSVLAKFGSKFRALSEGSKPVAAALKNQPAQPPARKSGSASTSKSSGHPADGKKDPAENTSVHARTGTQEEAWAFLGKCRPDVLEEDKLGEIWYAMIEELYPGKESSDLSIQEFGVLMNTIEERSVAAKN